MYWTDPAATLAHLRDRLARYEREAPDMMQSERIAERARIMGIVIGGKMRFPDQGAAFDEAVTAHNNAVAPVARVRTLRAA